MERIHFLPKEGLILIESKKGIRSVRLEYQLARLFEILCENQGNLVSKEVLIEWVWKENVMVGQEALPKNIWRLRKVLKENQLDVCLQVKTVPKRGYLIKVLLQDPTDENKTTISKPLLRRPAFMGLLLFLLAFTILSLCSIGEEIIILDEDCDERVVLPKEFVQD